MTVETEEGTYEGRPRLVKLVRDRIGQFLDGRNDQVVYEHIESSRAVVELRKKLLEEACEYVADPSVGELADVLEVCQGLAALDLGVPWDSVVAWAREKADERGGFNEGMGMWVTTVASKRHEGDRR